MSKLLGLVLALAGLGIAGYAWLPTGREDVANQQLANLVKIATDSPPRTAPVIPASMPLSPAVDVQQQPSGLRPATDRSLLGLGPEQPRATRRVAERPAAPGGDFIATDGPARAVTPESRRITSVKPADEASRRSLTRSIQAELKRVGCFDGEADGAWSPATRRAMKTFTERVNASLPVEEPDYILLTLLQGQTTRACGKGCPVGQVALADGRCEPRAILAQQAERQTKQQVEAEARRAKQETQRTAQADTDQRVKQDAEQRRREDAAKQDAQRVAKLEAEQRARQDAAKQDALRLAKFEAEQRAKQDAEQRRRDDMLRQEAQRLAKLESEQRGRQEAEQRRRDAMAKLETERLAKAERDPRQNIAAANPQQPAAPPSRLGMTPAQPSTAAQLPPVIISPAIPALPAEEAATEPIPANVAASPPAPAKKVIVAKRRPPPEREPTGQRERPAPARQAERRPSPPQRLSSPPRTQPRYVSQFVPPPSSLGRVTVQRSAPTAVVRGPSPNFRQSVFFNLGRNAP